MSMLAGFIGAMGSRRVSVANSLAAENTGAGAQTASITFKRDGTIVDQDSASLGAWITPRYATVGDSFYVKGTKTSGSNLTSGPTNDTYVALSSDQSFAITDLVANGASVGWGGSFSVSGDGTNAVSTGTGASITADRSS